MKTFLNKTVKKFQLKKSEKCDSKILYFKWKVFEATFIYLIIRETHGKHKQFDIEINVKKSSQKEM